MLQCKILVWNCQGLVNTSTQRALITLVRLKRPSIIFLSETLASPSLLDSLRISLGFDGCISSSWRPDCRGLALFWLNEVHVRLRHYSTRHIDVEIGPLGSLDVWRFTRIYGYSANGERRHTWDLLRILAAQSSLPWLVAGDYNEILSNAEKSGGPRRSAAPMARFREALVDCGLSDMGFVGPRFTWSNRHTKERLDRACQSSTWSAMFPCSRTITLPPSKSDHSPLLIEVSAELVISIPRIRRFRFEEVWFQSLDSLSVIKKGWSSPSTGELMSQVCSKVQATSKLLMEWNQGVFRQRQVE